MSLFRKAATKPIANFSINAFISDEDAEESAYFAEAFAFAEKHLFGKYDLLESGLLIKNKVAIDNRPIEVGLDVKAHAETISRLITLLQQKIPDPNEQLKFQVFYRTFLSGGNLVLHHDYSISVPKNELEDVTYKIQNYSAIERMVASKNLCRQPSLCPQAS
jgi:hypothetical protein